MLELDAAQVRRLRLRAQCLQPRQPRQALLEAVQAVCGIQAQSVPAMLLALRARVAGLTPADVSAAISGAAVGDQGAGHTLVRAWAMRSTLHLLPAADVRWLVSLLGPGLVAAESGRRRQLGLTDEFLARAVAALRAILADGAPLTRWELVDGLEALGITIDRRGQMTFHLIHYAALTGVVCCGPDRPNGEPTYALVDRWLPPQPAVDREAALAALARRYLRGYAPATVRDFAAWSGLTLRHARHACDLAGAARPAATGYVHASVTGQPDAYLLPPDAAAAAEAGDPPTTEPVVRLLPAFDDYLLGYADRSLIVSAAHAPAVYRGGIIGPAVIVDGVVAGVWRSERRGKRLELRVTLFATADTATADGIAAEADDVGRFLGAPVTIVMA